MSSQSSDGSGTLSTSNEVHLNLSIDQISSPDTLQKLLNHVSFALFVKEKNIETVCALSESGMAYLIAIAKAMRTSPVFDGMTATLARKIIYATMIGWVTFLISKEIHPNQILDRISSPGCITNLYINATAESKHLQLTYECHGEKS
ncbi:pyrroline-5-carboxylate reductase 1, mitochondrial-like [Brevipalpus obovatus]|uniref:pyrroline-5-carboxylate reductase 1, mitochondrial-like n=1 Tax=Brevipalpus obovatus TaxID=246614 RepID=UPI003D9E50D0